MQQPNPRQRSSRRAIAPAVVATIVCVAALACSKKPAPPAAPLKIAAASDLSFAFEELGGTFEKKTGTRATFTFGSTGLLAKQLAQGAPYDLFAAANVSFVDDVVKAGVCDGSTKTIYARGRIVLWWSKTLAVTPPTKVADLADGRFVHVAIANPEHAPYGKAAQQAMEHGGVWSAVQPKLVFGENVRQTLQFAESGNAEVAVVALSLALAAKNGAYVEIDPAEHAPIDQALVVCRKGQRSADGQAFAALVSSADGRAVMRRYGFLLPGEAPAH